MKPLEGVTVVDLTHALAGPVCAYQLSLLGANVIKVENPVVGDDFRAFMPTTFDAENAGKKSVSLNLKNPDALKVLERLVKSGDVLIDNFKPGTAEKFGLTWEVVQGWNDKIIWCSISGFGLSGPWRDNPAVEWSVQAASGLTDGYVAEDQDPRTLGLGVMDIGTGHMSTTSILAALLLRAKTGKGSRIDVGMIDWAMNLQGPRLLLDPGRPKRPGIGRFRAKDRRMFLMGAHQRWLDSISKVMGEPLLTKDPRFATDEARLANAEALLDAIEERLATRSAAEWEEAFIGVGVPAAVVRTLKEVAESEHVASRGILHQVKVEDSGATVQVVGPPYRIEGVALEPQGPVPSVGQHTDEVLGGIGYSAKEIEQLRADKIL